MRYERITKPLTCTEIFTFKCLQSIGYSAVLTWWEFLSQALDFKDYFTIYFNQYGTNIGEFHVSFFSANLIKLVYQLGIIFSYQ